VTARKAPGRWLSVVPPARPAAVLEDMGEAEATDWLRRMMGVSRDLCDAIDSYLGPEHPVPRPRLTVLPGGLAGDDE